MAAKHFHLKNINNKLNTANSLPHFFRRIIFKSINQYVCRDQCLQSSFVLCMQFSEYQKKIFKVNPMYLLPIPALLSVFWLHLNLYEAYY